MLRVAELDEFQLLEWLSGRKVRMYKYTDEFCECSKIKKNAYKELYLYLVSFP